MRGADRSELEQARVAVEGCDWRRALELLEGVAPTSERHELMARATYGAGEFEACISAWEDLHALLAAEGDRAGAARAAAMTAMYLMMDTGLMAPVRGWLRRAERLLAGLPEGPAHALVAMTRAYERLMSGDVEGIRLHADAAIEIGTRHDVGPAVVIGRVAAARVRIFDGDVDAGLDLLDEVGAVLMSGEVDALTTGMMYCELICAAQGLALLDRANEWTEVMERWRPGAAFGGINGRCRVHRAEMLRTSGPCDAAEAEALRACEELRPWMRREFGWPLVELGNVRLRKGDLDGAEEAYRAARDHAWSPEPGLALVQLARGEIDAAARSIADAIAHPFDYPSKERPPFGDLRLAPLLDAQVEIAAAAGDVAIARAGATRLRSIASSYPSRALDASASLAEARVALLDGDAPVAARLAGAAVATWVDMGAPYEAACARLVRAEACRADGSEEGARVELCAARDAFVEFGAERAAADAERRLEALTGRRATPDRRPGLRTGPHQHGTFRREGDMRTVELGGSVVRVRDLKGLRYVERLLAEPGREFHVLDLVAVERGVLPVSEPTHEPGALPGLAGGGLPVLDDVARDAYRRRLGEVDEDIAEAELLHDDGRLEMAQRERDYLVAELSRAVGLSGRRREVGGDVERARTSVARSMRYALDRLAPHHPVAESHLRGCLRTGVYCSYLPDPLAPVDWAT